MKASLKQIELTKQEQEKLGAKIFDFLKMNGYYEISKRSQLAHVPAGILVKAPLDFFVPNKFQPRRLFDKQKLKELSASMEEKKDVESPVNVTIRRAPDGRYFLFMIDGERRLRAAKMRNLLSISCLIYGPMTDDEVYIMSAKSNLGREDMSPIEEAEIIKNLRDKYGWSQIRISNELSKSQTYVSHTLRYLKLVKPLRDKLMQGLINKGWGLALSNEPDEYQFEHYKNLKQEETKKGKPLQQSEVNVFIRKKARKEKWESGPTGPKRRDKLSPEDLTINQLMRNAAALAESLDELRRLGKNQVLGSKTHIIDIEEALNGLVAPIQRQVEKLQDWD